ncbi:MAG: hypothetical protein DDT26_00749 [Dehalococcoidia bacterium]|nr:hypothetical protein [Chloroflexota bacterium]
MATTRSQFKDKVMRRLGWPVIEINVSDDQLEDRIDEAIRFFWDYSFDGTEREYYRIPVTQELIDNKFFDLPENIIGVVQMFPIARGMYSQGMFSVQYQFFLNNAHQIASTTIVPFFQTMQHLALIQEVLVGRVPIRYNRHRNRVHFDMSTERLEIGDFIILEAHMIVDPNVYPDVWNDRWLLRYACALTEQQWGRNITKLVGVQMLGGVTLNGDQIWQRATDEIAKLEDEMMGASAPISVDFIG